MNVDLINLNLAGLKAAFPIAIGMNMGLQIKNERMFFMDLVNYEELIFNKGNELCSVIHKKIYDKLRTHGIYPGQPELLLLIHYNEGIIQKELSYMNSTNESTIAIMLKKMEQGGYIERRANAKDKRALEVHLTEKGKDLVAVCEKCISEIRDEIFQDFTEEDYTHILRLLKKLQENVTN